MLIAVISFDIPFSVIQKIMRYVLKYGITSAHIFLPLVSNLKSVILK